MAIETLLQLTKLDKHSKNRIQLIFLKCCHETTLFWVNKDKNKQPKKIFLGHRTIYLLQLLKTNLLSETLYYHTQPEFICSNSAIITVE